jgi:NAD(P)-dependent dehydrogenase (short-subunit alcohol dehydrogenase family)
LTTFSTEALTGKRALVTGGSRGIGGAIVDQLVAMGADIVIADVDLDAARTKAAEVVGRGGHAEALAVDLVSREATHELARIVGPVDVLVNNAAPGQTNAPFVNIPDQEWELQFAVIMWAPLILTREIGTAMAERGTGGSIVNMLSASVRSPAPFVAPYAAAKAALEIITKCAALELGPRGVRTNGVAPTFVPTERNRAVWERVGFTEGSSRNNPSGRMATPEDVAGAVGWLCSDAAAYVNGQTIHVDGGSSAGMFIPPP